MEPILSSTVKLLRDQKQARDTLWIGDERLYDDRSVIDRLLAADNRRAQVFTEPDAGAVRAASLFFEQMMRDALRQAARVRLVDLGCGATPMCNDLLERVAPHVDLTLVDSGRAALDAAVEACRSRPWASITPIASLITPDLVARLLGEDGPTFWLFTGSVYGSKTAHAWDAAFRAMSARAGALLIENECFESPRDFQAIESRYAHKTWLKIEPLVTMGVDPGAIATSFRWDEGEQAVVGTAAIAADALPPALSFLRGEEIRIFYNRKPALADFEAELAAFDAEPLLCKSGKLVCAICRFAPD